MLLLARSGSIRLFQPAPSEDDLPRPAAPAAAAPRSAPPKGGPAEAPSAAPAGSSDERVLWEKRLARSRQTLDGYLQATRYPPVSRPIAEHPDLVEPNAAPERKLPLARPDGKLTDARVSLRQDRYFLVGDERVTFTIACENSDGPATCEVLSSTAGVPPHAKDAGAPRSIAVSFTGGPPGALVAILQPSTQGFAGHHGPIRLDLSLRVEGETGAASFDVEYTPAAPAVFTGKVREAVESGSLALYVEMDVERAGRYVLTARVDDSDGRSFAYLTFNEELGAGRREARLQVFGKLILDQRAPSPFRLRDVEGFLLREDAYPDREMMPAMTGDVYTTRRYALRDFSDAEWQSEEKDRHVKELAKDVEEAQKHVEGR